jgi:transcriptional regulator with XRE-family HTH domain
MKTKNQEFEVLVPAIDGNAVAEKVKVMIPLKWDDEVKEWLLTPEAHQIIEDTKARHLGLLLPAQFKELRERYGFSQKEMGELFQVGEKSWTRWETGKHRPSRSSNLPIRALYDGEISINYLLKQAGKPPLKMAENTTELVEVNFHHWLQTMLTSCSPAVEMVYPENTVKPVLIESKAGTDEIDFHIQMAKLAFEEHGMTGTLDAAGATKSSQRFVVTPPTHVYKQPRLCTQPTEA